MNKANMPLEKTVAEILMEIGVPTHIKGYLYLKKAIILVANDPTEIFSVMSLYEKVAKEFDTTYKRAERAIIAAREISCNRIKENPNVFLKILGPTGAILNSLCNSEFIATIAERIRLDMIDLAS